MSMMIKTAILGFGNPCRSDDAIGLFVIDELKKKLSIEQEHIQIFDMGTSAFEILFQLKGFDKFILIDAVINSGSPAGTLFNLPADVVMKTPVDDALVFLHSLKWDQALSYAKKMLGEAYPKDIDVYLIAIDNIKLEMQLSDTVRTAGMALVDKIWHTLNLDTQPTIRLEKKHLIIHHSLAKDILNNDSHLQGVYYHKDGVYMAGAKTDELFQSLHKTFPRMMKIKNLEGDIAVPIHDILIDNELDDTDRVLPFEVNHLSKIIRIFLR